MKVKNIIKLIEADGWYLKRMKGSHRQFKHNVKSGVVTVAGHPNVDLAKITLKSIYKQAGIENE